VPDVILSILFPWFIITLSACYFTFFLLISFAFIRERSKPDLKNKTDISVSVIIAARNEDVTLPQILSDLKQQDYPADRFNIIIADDHSYERINSLKDISELGIKNLTIIELPASVSGKKAALRLAAERSTSELLIFTDADCRVGPQWIKSYTTLYSERHPDLLFGLVDYQEVNGILQNFFRYEFLSLVITGAGSALLGTPTLCNGANMAISREYYRRVAGEIDTRSPSGDDVFALHQAKKNKRIIQLVTGKSATVYTRVPAGLWEYFNQRARWVSKSVYYRDMATVIISLLVIFANIFFIFSLIALIRNGYSLPCVFSLISKMIADYTVIIVGLYFFRDLRSVFWLPLFQLIYPVYLFISLFLGLFGIYRWKDRSY
jgi:cellulose synthase/poly-beta-1,6-N-acetylglucosamine synthase-like glycosyltransferase